MTKKYNKNNILLSEPVLEKNKIMSLLEKVLISNFPNEGKFTKILEKKISRLLKVKHVVATTSGTASIFLALKAIGIKRDDEVIVPNLTFPATANAVMLAGAKPILVDVDINNLLIDEKSLLKKINKKTKAIIPVHISGRGTNIKNILKIAKAKKLFVIEDAAEAFMSKIDKKCLGTYGDAGCFSFAPNKIITSGQGGIVVTNSKLIYKNLCQLKDQGRVGLTTGGEDTYHSTGYNFKFTNLQAVLGLDQLRTINQRTATLKSHYLFYKKNLIQNKKFKLINFSLKKGELPLWTDVYSVRRNKLFKYLKRKGINCRYYWYPLNTCKPYKKSFSGLNNSKKLYGKLMWLPSSLKLKKKDLIKVCYYINKFNLN